MANMTVGDLIEILEEVKEKHGDDVEVRLAHQPRWAFEYSVDARCGTAKVSKNEYSNQEVVAFYLAEGRQLGYLPQTASHAVGWSEPDYDSDDPEGPVPDEDFETFGN